MSDPAQPPGPAPPHTQPPPLPFGPSTGSSGHASQASAPAIQAANANVNMSNSFPKIEKLRDGNWLPWKTRIATVLERKEAYEVATGITPQPQDRVGAAIWRSKDLIARELITTAIKDEQIIHISECKTAVEMWEALRIIHAPRGQQSILSTKRALYSAQAEEGTDIAEHINDMKTLRDRLSLSGHRIDDTEFKSILVASLPRSWEGFTTSYLGYQGGTQGNINAQIMTVQELVSLLCEEDKRRKEKETRGEFAYVFNSSKRSQKGKRPCGICQRTNHVTADCRHKGKSKCDICGKFGHRSQDCWRNPLNKGKGRVTKNKRDTQGASSSKGKERAQVATEESSDSDSDDLPKAFASIVTVDENDEADVAEFSAYSWIADSGATTHICAQRNAFSEYTELPKKEVQGLGNKSVTAHGRGTVTIKGQINRHTVQIWLKNTLYVPEARENLISLGRIDSVGGQAICANGKIHIYDSNKHIIGIGIRKHNLYYMDVNTVEPKEQSYLAIKIKNKYTWAEWHRRLGHISINGLKKIHEMNLVSGMAIADSSQNIECEACIQAKLTRLPLPKRESRRERPAGELTHTDVWGPARVSSISGYRYYISFIDDATRHVVLHYMKTKDEASEKVKNYLTFIERQGQKCPKAVRADNGREYVNKDLIGWCHNKGIELQTTAPHTPEQNGVAERWNRTVLELSRAMLISRDMPSELWPEAMNYATYIRNRAYTRAIPDMTPYQKWTGDKPDISHIQEFGRIVWVMDEQINPSKLEPKANKHIFVGYEHGPRAIKFYDAQKKTLKVSCNYRFPQSVVDPNAASRSWFEGEKRETQSHNDRSESLTNKQPPKTAQEESHMTTKRKYIDEVKEERNVRQKKDNENDNPKEELPDLEDDPDEDADEMTSAEQVYMAFTDSTLTKDPKTLKEAMNSPDWPKWEKAVKTELATLNQMGTWEIADAPKNRNPIMNKWVFV